jgi:hypothetical protein
MRNLTNPRWIKIKGLLFLLLGLLAAVLLLFERPTMKAGLLLTLAVWCFCRFYYFAFYVIEHYVDPSFRFSGLLSFMRYLMMGRKKQS